MPVDHEDTAILREAYMPLAESVRRLIDVTIRTEADAATVIAATHQINWAADQLSSPSMPMSFGVRQLPDGSSVAFGNVVMGVRNPVAPPLVIHRGPDGTVWADFVLGAAYEGPAGHVHGGVCALVLDHLLGATAHLPGKPAYTGTITLRYVRGTRLGPLHAHARVDRKEGVKTFSVGHIADDDGITVQAEGIFITPTR
jgi:acyl-coenzyme A thioesterase PaaI-like protein